MASPKCCWDDGWQKGRLGTDVDTAKFPDFAATAAFIRSQGLALGLWLSCYRDRDSRDLAALPEAPILPPMIRSPSLPGLAMSFTSPWRDFYVKDMVEVAKRFGVSYFKQDFTNIMFGDMAEGHERPNPQGVALTRPARPAGSPGRSAAAST